MYINAPTGETEENATNKPKPIRTIAGGNNHHFLFFQINSKISLFIFSILYNYQLLKRQFQFQGNTSQHLQEYKQ